MEPKQVTMKPDDYSSQSPLEGKKILVVDDEHMNRELLKDILRSTGAEVISAANGKEAIDAYLYHKDINVVLMDIKMPEMDGWEAINIIRGYDQELPIIVQTAHNGQKEQKQADEMGCEFLSKPLKKETLLKLITNLS